MCALDNLNETRFPYAPLQAYTPHNSTKSIRTSCLEASDVVGAPKPFFLTRKDKESLPAGPILGKEGLLVILKHRTSRSF